MIRFRLALLLTLLPALPASAISLNSGGYFTDFSLKPDAGDFSTRTVAGAATDITTEAQLDARVQTLAADTVNLTVPDATDPPGATGTGLYSAQQGLILTKPTGVRASVLMATITNDTGSLLTGLTAEYDFGRSGGVGGEQIDGQRVYLSLTGAVNEWTALGTFSSVGQVSIPLSLSVPAGGSFYLLWADDNGPTSPDDGFSIDNFSLTPDNASIPEPSVTAFSVLCLGGLAARRRRR